MRFFSLRSAPLINWRAIFFMPIIGAVIGLMGPFASYGTMDWASRMAHFAMTVTLIGSMVIMASYYTARHFFQGYWPLWAALCIDLLLAVPGAAIVWGSIALFAPDALDHIRWLDLVWQNLLLILAFRAASLIISWRRIRYGPTASTMIEPKAVSSELVAKLPHALRGERVLAVSAEDHYLRVHTPRGEALIHMSLVGAVAMLGDGFQVHRSHWVAREAIRSSGSSSIQLVTGLSLPLSRHRAKEFRVWLDNPSEHANTTPHR